VAGFNEDILKAIGNTPLVRLNKVLVDAAAQVLVKIEGQNPGGSVKSRIGYAMLAAAAEAGHFAWGETTIIEPTSGNTGIGLALAAAVRGNRLILTMPESMSEERRRLLASYGAELELTAAADGMRGAIGRAQELLGEIPGAYMPSQFENPANPAVHEATTGPEIWRDTNGQVDVFVAGVGTGGTITGVGRYLRHVNPDVEIVAVEPAGSPVLSGGEPGKHGIQGIGAGFQPAVLDMSIIDRVVVVSDDDAKVMARRLATVEGILCGISSGAAAHAAVEVAASTEPGKTVVTILPDTGERYLSTDLFAQSHPATDGQ
jgi:cysteine synthase